MFNKRNLIRLVILVLIFNIIFLTISGRGCPKRSRDKIGSSKIPEWSLPAPSGLTAEAVSPYQINLSWQDNSSNEDGFEIESRPGGTTGYSPLATVGRDETSYSNTGLAPFITYYYRVRAYTAIGDRSNWSNEAGATTNINSVWSAVAAGDGHTIALTSDGTLWSWGWNNNGQLGLNDYISITITLPSQIGSDRDYRGIEAGFWHSLAIKTDQTLWAWGYNDSGQLGLDDTDDRYSPSPVGTNSDWLAVSGGGNHTLGLKMNGTLWSWGFNRIWTGSSFAPSGQLGLGDIIDRWTPSQIGSDTDWVLVSCGYAHTVGLKTNGTVWAWGYNYWGQLGDGTIDNRTTPGMVGTDSDWLVPNGANLSTVSASYSRTTALKTNLTLWAWGAGYSYGLPTKIGVDSDWRSVSASGGDPGLDYAIALKTIAAPGGTSSTFWSWGNNASGQLGLRDTINRTTPTQVGADSDWLTSSTGSYHVIALKNNGTLWLWGNNQYGQLGLGDTINRYIPCPFGSPAPPSFLVATVISGVQINLSWIDNAYNEQGFKIERRASVNELWNQIAMVNTDVTSYLDLNPFVSDTVYHYRLRAYNEFGNSFYSNEVYVMVTGGWLAVKSGWYHSVGLKTNGTLWAWGKNDSGQLGDGTTDNRTTPRLIGSDSDWIAISGGGYHTLGLKTNGPPAGEAGILWAWGKNDLGQLGDGTTDNRTIPRLVGTDSDWIAVAGGGSHSLGLKSNSTLWAWGQNVFGQLGDGTQTSRTTPRQIGTDSDWITVSGGGSHSLGLKDNSPPNPFGEAGTLWAWGYNEYDQLGDGTKTLRTTPCLVGIDSDWLAVSGGRYHSLGLKTNGALLTWGWNVFGQLGRDYGPTNIPIPVSMNNPSHIPSNLTVIATSSTQIDLSWVDNCPIEEGFKIERKTLVTGYSLLATVGPNVTTYQDSGLSSGTTYYYRLRAYNTYSDTPYSNETSATTP